MEILNSNPVLKTLLENTQTLWVDIDGTLSDTIGAALAEIRERYGDVMDISRWKSWDPHQIAELQKLGIATVEDTIELFYSILKKGWSQVVAPIADSQKGIEKLQMFWKKLIALSGRMEDSREYTRGWLEENYPWVFQKILLTDHDTPRQVPKYQIAHEQGISVMIEDNAHYAIDLATHDIPTILLAAPWNVDIDTSSYSGIHRVKDWKEILTYLG